MNKYDKEYFINKKYKLINKYIKFNKLLNNKIIILKNNSLIL